MFTIWIVILVRLELKAKGAWDAIIQSSGGDSALIDVQNWCDS